jgi:hypothetical protein
VRFKLSIGHSGQAIRHALFILVTDACWASGYFAVLQFNPGSPGFNDPKYPVDLDRLRFLVTHGSFSLASSFKIIT